MPSTRYFCLILIKLVPSRQIFEKCSNVTFHENSSNGSRVVSCGRTYGRTDRQTGMTKLIAAFRNYAKRARKMGECEGKRYVKDWFQPIFPPPNLTPSQM